MNTFYFFPHFFFTVIILYYLLLRTKVRSCCMEESVGKYTHARLLACLYVSLHCFSLLLP